MGKRNRGFAAGIILLIVASCFFCVLSLKGSSFSEQDVQQQEPLIMIVMILLTVLAVVIAIFFRLAVISNNRTRKHIEAERDNMERIINTMPTPVFIVDNDRNIRSMNDAACKAFQMKQEEMIGKPCCLLGTNICNTPDCAIEKMIKEGIGHTYLETNNHQQMVSTAYLKDYQGKNIGFIEVMQDITELMNTQKMLEERSLELETISENLLGGVLITSLEKGFPILKFNQGYLELVGGEKDNMIGKPAVDWLINEEKEILEQDIHEQLAVKGTVNLEHQIRTSDGNLLWVSVFGKQAILHGIPIGIWMLIDISERKKTEETMLINEERYRIASQNSEDMIIDYDILDDRMIYSGKTAEIYGIVKVMYDIPNSLFKTGIIAKESEETIREVFEKLRKGEEKVSCELCTIAKEGVRKWNQLIFTNIFDGNGKPVRSIGVMHDFTEEKNALLQYKREAQYRKITTEDAELYYEVDLTNGIFITGHEDLVNHFGNGNTNKFDEVKNLMLEYLVFAEDRDIVEKNINSRHMMDCYLRGEYKIEFEYRRIVNSGKNGWVNCTIYLLQDEDTKEIRGLGYINDIDKVKKRELFLREQAERDLLTGLYNKITTETLISEDLKFNQNKKCSNALIIVDLDNFKQINDNLGHAFGDAVLSEVSQKLKGLFRNDDIIGRIGGDEFIVYMRNISDENAVSKHAKEICSMLKGAYSSIIDKYKISSSVGIAVAPRDGVDFNELYRKADIALYYAKNYGKGNYHFFEDSLPQIGSVTSIRAIDNNAGKLFSKNIVEYVLRILYEAKDPCLVVTGVLELVAKHFNYSRGYIFERHPHSDNWNNTYEWCANGISHEKDNLQNISFSDIKYEDLFDKDGLFILNDINDLPEPVYQLIEPQNIKSFIQFQMFQENRTSAYMGFDDCLKQRIFEKDEIDILKMVTILLDFFLYRYNLR